MRAGKDSVLANKLSLELELKGVNQRRMLLREESAKLAVHRGRHFDSDVWQVTETPGFSTANAAMP